MLSSVTSPDCQQYRAFLQAVPSSWIHPAPVQRTDPLWRAFRGQPGPASQKQALVIIQTMYGALCDAGYLVANPMRALMKGFDLPASKVDIKRSFTEAEWNPFAAVPGRHCGWTGAPAAQMHSGVAGELWHSPG